MRARRKNFGLGLNWHLCIVLQLVFLHCAVAGRKGRRAGDEITFPAEQFAKLDQFEGLNLEDGDKLFAKKDYKGAFAAYKAYSNEFPKGKAVAYALLRMGRCLHLLHKRNAAVKMYQEVVDYFPNDVVFAAGALYYMGRAHMENGDDKKCIATWARMVKDKGYVTQPNSGTALNYLAKQMDKARKYEEATKYRWRIAVNFRMSNSKAANESKEAVRYHYVVRQPNHEKFLQFYKEVGGWSYREKTKDAENGSSYWNTVFDRVLRGDGNESNQAREARVKAAGYWVAKLGSKLKKNDQIQAKAIDLRLMVDKDKDAWVARLNKQAASAPMAVGRFVWWVGVFSREPQAQAAFLDKHKDVISSAGAKQMKDLMSKVHKSQRLAFFQNHLAPRINGLKREEQFWLLDSFMHSRTKMYDEAKVILYAIDLNGVSDKELRKLGEYAGTLQGEDGAMRFFNRMKDKKVSFKAKYDWYVSKSNYDARSFRKDLAEKALAMMPEIRKTPTWAQATLWPKARILHRMAQYPEAIKAYKATNRQPDATWSVVECLIAMKNYKKAISTVKTLESVRKTASKACLKAADIYKTAGNKPKEIEQLRVVLHRYPGTGEASQAHQRLEGYGAKITGGEANARDE